MVTTTHLLDCMAQTCKRKEILICQEVSLGRTPIKNLQSFMMKTNEKRDRTFFNASHAKKPSRIWFTIAAQKERANRVPNFVPIQC
mmetsp:Transcript_13963/g.31284  ORF Transcript_13963/g.31284 Transcript_13963/m.31284 type:complete len:86 (+) Transcript_13963:216-473(+)